MRAAFNYGQIPYLIKGCAQLAADILFAHFRSPVCDAAGSILTGSLARDLVGIAGVCQPPRHALSMPESAVAGKENICYQGVCLMKR